MLRPTLAFIVSMAGFQAGLAQSSNHKQDVAAIKAQCGCHEVTFAYAETFSPDKQYQFRDRYEAKGLEWVFVDEEKGPAGQPTKLVLQHLLIVDQPGTGGAAGEPMIIKHWREDWQYENTSLLQFDHNATWKRVTLPKETVRGQWTQKVFEVDDSPRYEGSATWVHLDGRQYWENTTDAPLPRREYTKRSDYNVMRRTNHHEITPDGYRHEQDNDKISRSEAGDQLIASEKGLNKYKRTDDSRCNAAKAWWQRERAYWVDVRSVWDEVLAGRQTVALRGQVKGNVLSRELEALSKQAAAGSGAVSRAAIRETITKYLK